MSRTGRTGMSPRAESREAMPARVRPQFPGLEPAQGGRKEGIEHPQGTLLTCSQNQRCPISPAYQDASLGRKFIALNSCPKLPTLHRSLYSTPEPELTDQIPKN